MSTGTISGITSDGLRAQSPESIPRRKITGPSCGRTGGSGSISCGETVTDWADELDRGVAPERFAELRVPVEQLTAAPVSRVEFNSPWEDGAEQAAVPENGVITFPPFRRSLVARFCF